MRLSTIRKFIAATVAAAAAMAGMAHSADAGAAAPDLSKTEVKYAAAPLDGFDCDPMAVKAPAAKIKPHHIKKAVAHTPAAPLTLEQKIAQEARRLERQKASMAAAIDKAYTPPSPTAMAKPMFKCVRKIAGVTPAFLPSLGSTGSPNHPPAASYPAPSGGHGLNPGGLPSYLTPSSGPGYGSYGGGGSSPPSYGGGGGGGGGHVPPAIIFPPSIGGGGGGGGGWPSGPSVKPPPPRPGYCGLVDAGKLRDDSGSCGPKPPVNPPVVNPPPVNPPPVVNPPPPVKPPVNPPEWCKGLTGGPDTPHILEKCGPGVQPPPPPPTETCLTNKNLPQCQTVHHVPEPNSGALAGVALAAAALLSLRRGKLPTVAIKAAKKFTP